MEWLLGIVGGIAAFLGLFIIFAGEDSSVGIGGDLSWRVGDISSAWMYGLLIGGGLLLLIALSMVVFAPRRAEYHVRTERADLKDLIWHAGIFLAVNAFIWLQDIAIGGGLEYAYWVTIPWGVGLVVHALVYYFTRGRRELAIEEKARELQPH